MTLENYSSPPEAPVFYPTCDEFADPLEYVEKIRPIASRAGLCKIIPPKVSYSVSRSAKTIIFFVEGMASAILR